MTDAVPTPEAIIAALEEAKEASNLPEEYFQFRISLLKAEAEAVGSGRFSLTRPDLPDEALAERLTAGLPLLDAAAFSIEPGLFTERVEAVAAVFETDFPFAPDLVEAVKDQPGTAAVWPGALLGRDKKALKKISADLDMDPSIFSFFLTEVLRPLIRPVAEALRPLVDEELWKRDFCPVCGAFPGFSKYEGEGGARYLACSLCDTVWKYQRIKCPFCTTDGKPKGTFIHFEDDPRYRIDTCNSCKRYLKVLDVREVIDGTEVLLRAEDIKTLYLDLAAERQGFKK